jgi:starvation-inducible outer membrane lipoprotein
MSCRFQIHHLEVTFAMVLSLLITGCDTIPNHSIDQSPNLASNQCELQELESVAYHPTEKIFTTHEI